MTSSRRQVLLASAALLGSSWAALAAGSRSILQWLMEYTATSLIGTDERTMPGRLWRTPSSLRHEGKLHGCSLTVIARLDRNLCWLVMAEPRFAIETDLSALDLPEDVITDDDDVANIDADAKGTPLRRGLSFDRNLTSQGQ